MNDDYSIGKGNWNGKDFSPLNKEWMSQVDQKWKDREANKIKNYTKAQIYEMGYRWSSNQNCWVDKHGKPAPEIGKRMTELVMGETKAPEKSDLLEYYNQMVQTGKDPLTGRKLENWEIEQAKTMQVATALEPAYQAVLGAMLEPKINEYGKKTGAMTVEKVSGAGVEEAVTHRRVQG